MIPLNRTYAPLQVLADELARCGLTDAVCSPGSRNAPIALVLAAEDRIRTHSVLDERSAGFMALGIAKATGRPVVLTCTSGTAAANFHPAVIEAYEAHVPLIVLTADRPPELRDVGAGQAIDQIQLFGSSAKWFVEAGNHDPGPDTAAHFRSLACRAFTTAIGGRPGPVHINLPLREPLAPVQEEMPAADWAGRPDGSPWTRVVPTRPAAAGVGPEAMAERIRTTPRGVIVCGQTSEAAAAEVVALAQAAGWPVLAEPTSGVRCGAHDRSRVVAHYDPILRAPAWAKAQRPDLALRIGDMPTSKALRAWVADAQQVVIDPQRSWNEPTRRAGTIVPLDAATACRALADAVGPRDPDESWLDTWLAADLVVREELRGAEDPFEPRAYTALAESLPDGATVWISSSMPIRDVEAFFPSVAAQIRFLSNRGANGIDGVVSSALGAAAASAGPCVLLTGELALLHDLGGLVARARLGIDITILCVNNGGGGIFDFLPVAGVAEPGPYEELIATPHDVSLETVAALAGMEYRLAATQDEIRAAAAGSTLVEVRTDRASNVAEHRALLERIAARL